VFTFCLHFCLADSTICWSFSCYQGCGAGTQISGSSYRHLNFLAPAPTSRSSAPALERFGQLKTKNYCIICTTRMPHNLLYGTGTQISSSSSGSTMQKFLAPAAAPATQTCLVSGSGSTALAANTHCTFVSASWKRNCKSFPFHWFLFVCKKQSNRCGLSYHTLLLLWKKILAKSRCLHRLESLLLSCI